MKQRSDLTGQKFGRLTAIKLITTTKRSEHLWKCDCGNEKQILTINVTKGHVVSCGCYMKELAAKNASIRNRKPDGVAAFNHLLRNYKARAKSRNQEFLLSEDDFRSLVTGNCYYCGIEPCHEYNHYKSQESGTFLYNGIDRIDSTKGYTKENSVSCCWICNRAKGELSQEQFYAWSKRLYESRFGVGNA